MRREIGYAMLALGIILAAAGAYAAAPTGADVRALSSTRGAGGGSAGTVLAQAGNITELEINGTMVSKAWTGYFGNITGNITLEDANGNKLYKWGIGTTQGEVYASRNSTITWTGVNCSNQSYIAVEEASFGMGPSDPDNITATFATANAHPAFYVGNLLIPGDYTCYTAYTYVNNASQSTVFAETILNDATNRTVYVALINDSTTGFDGKAHDFQMIVPEDGHTPAAETALTTYYFWTELN